MDWNIALLKINSVASFITATGTPGRFVKCRNKRARADREKQNRPLITRSSIVLLLLHSDTALLQANLSLFLSFSHTHTHARLVLSIHRCDRLEIAQYLRDHAFLLRLFHPSPPGQLLLEQTGYARLKSSQSFSRDGDLHTYRPTRNAFRFNSSRIQEIAISNVYRDCTRWPLKD